MCGIVFSLSFDSQQDQRLETLRSSNHLRGPDSSQSIIQTLKTDDGAELRLDFTSSVLHLRGSGVTAQPHVNEAGDILCWNGEVFEGIDIGPKENDGTKLFAALTATIDVDVPGIMSRIEGPYAFLFYRNATKTLYFARDPLGRRSLLIQHPKPHDPHILISSVGWIPPNIEPDSSFEEVSAAYIYQIDISKMCSRPSSTTTTELEVCIQPLNRFSSGQSSDYSAEHTLSRVIPPSDLPTSADNISGQLSQAVSEFLQKLLLSVRIRVQHIPKRDDSKTARVAVLFSGGIDCTVIAFMAHQILPLDEPIDLLNVAFENPRKIEAAKVKQDAEAASLLRPKKIKRAAVASPPHFGSTKPLLPSSPTTGLNDADIYMVPDRETGLEQLEELQRLSPGRKWNFVKVDVSYEETMMLSPTVEALMFPSRTVMDLSLARALYFASRGRGKLHCATQLAQESTPFNTEDAYNSPARVLLSGLGADELMGGYSRHRLAFKRGSWEALIDELQLDLDRLPSRNLGRDDRVISANAKETRYPYLSLPFVGYLASLPVHMKLDPRMEEGTGDKWLLREAARRLGLVGAAARKKRAMQFGSRSAKMNGGKEEKKGDMKLGGLVRHLTFNKSLV